MATNTSCIINIPTRHDIPLLTSLERNDTTEQVLEELYQEKCAISVPQDDISYIQKNVECFVVETIQKVVESETYQNCIHAVDRKDLIQLTEHFREDHLLEVGSFYEGTKNNYPDEFDFLFVQAECAFKDNELLQVLTSDLSGLFHEKLEELISGPSLEIGEVFEQCSYTGLHGPASKIKLIFQESTHLRDHTIFVDISVASRVRLVAGLPKQLKICYDEWKEMILKTGTFLVINVYKSDHPKHETGVKFTITETEQYFVRYEMSEKHRKVYRLLKYIFNGNDANEELRKLVRRPENGLSTGAIKQIDFHSRRPLIVYELSSYTIKTLMFHHVHQCQNAENGITECLTQVLRSLMIRFNKHIDNYYCSAIFSVSVMTMLQHPLEIADDYTSAKKIRKNLSRLTKTLANKEQSREAKRANLDDQIPFTGKNLKTVKGALDYESIFSRTIVIIAFLFIIMFIMLNATVIAYEIVESFQTQKCSINSDTPRNKSIDVQLCCEGTKHSADIWRNVTCLKSNVFSRHTDDPDERFWIHLKSADFCMALTVAQSSDINDDDGIVNYASIGVTLCEVNESKNEEGLCSHCNASIQDTGYNEQGKVCTGVAPCHLYTLVHQKTKADTREDELALAHYCCKIDEMCRTENLTVDPLQTKENTTRDDRTDISSGNASSNASYHPSEECAYYTNVKDAMKILLFVSVTTLIMLYFCYYHTYQISIRRRQYKCIVCI